MKTHGMPERFWVVTKPSPASELCDVCFPCTFDRLIRQVRGGLQEDEIVGIYANENEARQAAERLLGRFPVRPQDALAVEVVVHVMLIPNDEEMAADEMAKAAVEAVSNAVRDAEKRGHRHRLEGRVSLGMSQTVEMRNMMTPRG
jgi:hypothetical protein